MERSIVAKSDKSKIFYPRPLTLEEVEEALTNNVVQHGESDAAHFEILEEIAGQDAYGIRRIAGMAFVDAAHFREVIEP